MTSDASVSGTSPDLAATSPHATLLALTTADGAGGHCAGTARRPFHERAHDWLVETLG